MTGMYVHPLLQYRYVYHYTPLDGAKVVVVTMEDILVAMIDTIHVC